MPRYKVNKRYSAMYNNATRLDYTTGAEVDLPEQQAEWVNRDCPGTLTLIEPEAAAEEPAVEPETAGQDTDDEPAAEEAPAVEADKPARNRAHTPSRTRK